MMILKGARDFGLPSIPQPPPTPRFELVDADLIAENEAAKAYVVAAREAARAADTEVARLVQLDAAAPTDETLQRVEQAREGAKHAAAVLQRAKAIASATRQRLCAIQHERARDRCAAFPALRKSAVDDLFARRSTLLRELLAALDSPQVHKLMGEIDALTAQHVELERNVDEARWILNELPDEARTPYHLRRKAEDLARNLANGRQLSLLRLVDDTRTQLQREIDEATEGDS
jgi:hypothetical protein